MGVPRAIWSGSISFGLVNVPVRMYSAIEEKDLHFHYVHAPDASRIGYEKICKAEGKSVPDEEIVKAFEYEKGEYVYLGDEDFEAAEPDNLKTIDIRDFVPYEEIDPIFFEKTYYLGPQENAEKVYALLREAMERSGLAAIAKYVMRDKQHLGCLRVRDGTITLEKMYFADEVRPTEGVAPKGGKIDERELEMASKLIESFTGKFEPEKYEDTYRDALCEIIRAKRAGTETHAPEMEEPERPTDLMAALRASLEAAQSRRSPARSRAGKGRNSGSANRDLERLSKEDVYRRAKELDIKGRADMSKEELVEAVRAAA
ncbi:MAG: Ku protein [Actinomycetota bacterium]|nr:Ku protein [Actinomycetota bacterium]